MLTDRAAEPAAPAFCRRRVVAGWRGLTFVFVVLAIPVGATAAEPGLASPPVAEAHAALEAASVGNWTIAGERRRDLLRMSAGDVDGAVAAALARHADAASAAEAAARQVQARSRAILATRAALSANAARLARTSPSERPGVLRLASMLAVMAPSVERWRREAVSAVAAAAALREESGRAARQAEREAAAHWFDLAMALAEIQLELALAETPPGRRPALDEAPSDQRPALAEASSDQRSGLAEAPSDGRPALANVSSGRQPALADPPSWHRPGQQAAAGFPATDAALETIRPAAGPAVPEAARAAMLPDGLALLAPDPDLGPLVLRSRDAAEAGGLPIVGPVSTRFDRAGAGLLDRGITFASELAQPVRAPRTGVVAFAGPFKSFGLLLIVEHGHEYHSLLAGMARLDVRVGDVVVAGQTIGSITGSEAMPGRLYLELRHNGRPVNPLPWLAAREDKVRG